jgi:arsenite methyltransferase
VRTTPDYGLDAPGLCRGFLLSGAAALTVGGLLLVFRGTSQIWAMVVAALLMLAALYLLGMGCLMLFWSRVQKIRVRDKLLDLIPWRGDEQVLDVGCGRGLMMIGAAGRLTSGRATGIDIWQAADQSGNTAGAALANAQAAGVADRVTIQTADMRALPFADGAFDVVLSHWTVHNLDAARDRTLALEEIARVLRPGGLLVLADIAHRHDYMAQLATLGFADLRIIMSPVQDTILRAVSFGSFGPAAIYGPKS